MTDRPKLQCCGPSRWKAGGSPRHIEMTIRHAQLADMDRMRISGGIAMGGTAQEQIPDDGEGPIRRRKIKPFLIGMTTVTNEQFQHFVAATNYVTEAERFGWSFVFHDQVDPNDTIGPIGSWTRLVADRRWCELAGDQRTGVGR